jgi:hypothetical protein
MTITMPTTGFHQQAKLVPGQINQISNNVFRYRGSTVPVLGIVVVILPSQIVNESKVLDYAYICPSVFCQQQAVMPDPGPIWRTVNAIPVQAKFTAGELYEARRY